nr:DUF1963 domain-containing protein [Lachnospiraceae bacterium]
MSDNVIFILIIAFAILFWAALIVFIIIRRKRREGGTARKNAAGKRPAPLPDIGLSPEELDRLLARVEENTRRESLRAVLSAEPAPGLFDSKVGGLPYWDLSRPYPADKNGDPLALLAQIDLARLPENGLLPREGLLQFFILPDDLYGMDFDVHDSGNGFRVVWHETVDRSVTEDAVRALAPPTSLDGRDDLPHCGVFALRFVKETVHIGEDDALFDRELRRAAAELGFRLPDVFSLYRALQQSKEYTEKWVGINEGTRLLGYPYFVQGDPRPEDTPYGVLLFQLDSYFAPKAHPGSSPERSVMWGDAGVGNFFIRQEDLRDKRFDRIYYTWDCG